MRLELVLETNLLLSSDVSGYDGLIMGWQRLKAVLLNGPALAFQLLKLRRELFNVLIDRRGRGFSRSSSF